MKRFSSSVKTKIVILLTILIIIINVGKVNADVGSFDSYSSDWDSSSWDSDWGSSSSSSLDSDWDSDSSYSGGGNFIFFGGSPAGMIIFIIVILLVSYAEYKNKQRKRNDPFYNGRKNNSSNSSLVYTTPVHDVPQTHFVAEKVKEVDPLFSEEKFLSYAKNLYVKMQHAWTERSWEEMRPLETPDLFQQHLSQLNEYIKSKTINVVDRISVNYATIYGFRQTEDKDIIEVALKATKKDYIIYEDTKEVKEGNKDQYRVTVYKMTFERTKGLLTKEGTDDLDSANCPNCGAPLNITASGKCEYCGSIVTTGIHDWVLSGLEPIVK